ncbi:MAG TPA: hypothetical protein VGY32_14485 [Solirubrobacteraceae bacterium]|nr:hypothetical protein [Solirubrobacteraceae bacterium]
MGPKRRIALVVVAIILGVAALPGAAQAFGENGGTETGQATAPANGIATESTDTLPANSTQADITVTPPISDQEFFSHLKAVLGGPYHDNFSDRALHCILITEDVAKDSNFFPGYQIKGKTVQVLFLYACLELALEVSLSKPAQDHARPAAAAGCSIRPRVAAIKTTRSGSGFSAMVSPAPASRNRRTTVKLTCRRTAKGLVIKIRPRKRGQKLRSTIGSQLQVGFANPTSHAVPLKISFTVK